jgi:hypothetical protein
MYNAYTNLDIDRLHAVDCSDYYSRQTGRTVRFAMSLLGDVWLGSPNNKYLYICDNSNRAKILLHEFAMILRDEQIYHDIDRALIHVGDPNPCTIQFGGWYNTTSHVCYTNRWDNIYVDLNWYNTNVTRESMRKIHQLQGLQYYD